MTHHEGFGKVLATLKRCSLLGGTDHGDALQLLIVAEEVVHALHQRILGANDYHIHAIGKHKGLDALEVGCREGYILAYFACTRVTGSDIQFLYFRTLANLPSQGMLTSATA